MDQEIAFFLKLSSLGGFCGNHSFTAVKPWFSRIQGSRNRRKSLKNAIENQVRKIYAKLEPK
jgi:hypothetical protein